MGWDDGVWLRDGWGEDVDKWGEGRPEGREIECDGCWGVIGVRVIGWVGLGV